MDLDDSTSHAISIDEEILLQHVQMESNDSIIAIDEEKLPPDDNEIESEQRESSLETSMKEEMDKVLPFDSEKCSIYRVPIRQFNMNSRVYTPQVISIGPFHHGRENLKAMEQHKLLALKIYLRRINMSIENAIATARNWEKEARGCYAEPINMNQDEFVRMMLVDGCFLLEFMLLIFPGELFSTNQNQTLDCLFLGAMSHQLCSDFIMLENQLPLFVLKNLFNILSLACKEALKEGSITFDILIQHFIEVGFVRLSSDVHPKWDIKTKNANHLLHLFSDYYIPTLLQASQSRDPSKVEGTRNFQCSFSVFSSNFSCSSNKEGNDENIEHKKFSAPPTLTELWEAGVTIKKSKKEKHSMEISFKDGVLQIPHFEIDDEFEARVRNVMAFEHYHMGRSKRYVTNYIIFLVDLISTEKDVSLLVEAEILTNKIGGSHKEIYKLFNDLCKGVIVLGGEKYYSDMTEAMNKYCKAMRHRWMASLRRDYFNSPWTSLSFFAATFLITLTFLQTLYSLLSYYKSNSH